MDLVIISIRIIGFNQYFVNSSGDFAHETIKSLRVIGANHTADILQRAIDEFPDKKVPNDRDKRTDIVEQIEETANEKWEALDQRFFEYKDNLNLLNIEYVKKFCTEFEDSCRKWQPLTKAISHGGTVDI